MIDREFADQVGMDAADDATEILRVGLFAGADSSVRP